MNSSRRATGVFTFFSVLLLAGGAGSARSQTSNSIYTIPKGTEIRVRMDNEINSESSSSNDTFTATVSSPVVVREVVVLPVGTVIEGKIINVRNASLGKKRGSLEVRFETVYLPGGVKRQIDAEMAAPVRPKSSPRGSILTIAGAAAIGAAIGTAVEKTRGALIGAGLGLGVGTGAVFLQKGDEARIKAGEEFSIVLRQDVTLPAQDY